MKPSSDQPTRLDNIPDVEAFVDHRIYCSPSMALWAALWNERLSAAERAGIARHGVAATHRLHESYRRLPVRPDGGFFVFAYRHLPDVLRAEGASLLARAAVGEHEGAECGSVGVFADAIGPLAGRVVRALARGYATDDRGHIQPRVMADHLGVKQGGITAVVRALREQPERFGVHGRDPSGSGDEMPRRAA